VGVLGRAQPAIMRVAMRFVNAVPDLKHRTMESATRLRKVDQVEAWRFRIRCQSSA
jgi:hypothetical protein